MGTRLITLLLAIALPAFASEVPPNARVYLPQLVEAQQALWPDAPIPAFIAGQIEQESCITLTHSLCWNPRAELKTKRENGIGLGQFTRARRADGSIRFDTISDLARTYPELKGWSWETRYNALWQLKAIVLMDRGIYRRISGSASDTDRVAFTLSAYNGGEAGLMQDRRLCRNTPGCDPARWKGNVATTSLKARRPHPGYKKSFFEINREYVANILDVRRQKYAPYFGDANGY